MFANKVDFILETKTSLYLCAPL